MDFAYIQSSGPHGEPLTHAVMVNTSALGGYQVYDPSITSGYVVSNDDFIPGQIYKF